MRKKGEKRKKRSKERLLEGKRQRNLQAKWEREKEREKETIRALRQLSMEGKMRTRSQTKITERSSPTLPVQSPSPSPPDEENIPKLRDIDDRTSDIDSKTSSLKVIPVRSLTRSAPPPRSPQTQTLGGTMALTFPLITMGTTQVQIPLPLGTVREIKETCPKPRKDPCAAVHFLKRYCEGARMSQEDMEVIITAVDPETTANIFVSKWVDDSKLYQDEESWPTFWNNLLVAWRKAYKPEISIHDLLSCKQQTGEYFHSFVPRLFKMYTSCDIQSPELFVSMAMNNGDPKVTQIIKLANQGILKPVICPWNTPINPVRKANGAWRMVQDLQGVNNCIQPSHVSL